MKGVVGLALLLVSTATEIKTPLYLPGQRELIVGAAPFPETILSVIHRKEIPADYAAGVYAPSFWDEYRVGQARWSVTDSELFQRPCRKISLLGQTETKLKFGRLEKPVEVVRRGSTTWFVDLSGRILRQDVVRHEPDGIYEAHCTYSDDRIEVQVSQRGERSIKTVFPESKMAALQRQFEPMVSGDRILLSEKDFLVYDPFTGGFQAWSVRQSGKFNSVWLEKRVKGLAWEIRLPDYAAKAFVTDEGELVKVELPNDNMMYPTAQDVGGSSIAP